MTDTLTQRTTRAAERFPDEWQRWATETGDQARKRRTELRKAAERADAEDRLRAAGQSCASCQGFAYDAAVGTYCSAVGNWRADTQSTPVSSSDLCFRHQPR